MKLTTVILSGTAALATLVAASNPQTTAAIYVQAVSVSAAAPAQLAEIQYNIQTPSAAEILSYEAPEVPDETKLVRVGVYDPSTKEWASSTSVASIENFGKGYSPTLMLSVDTTGAPVSAALKGVAIDAGQTRDFGPQVMVLVAEMGRQPDLNKPVVLSAEGKQVVPEEKSMLQKYWWLIAIAVLLTVVGGGDDKK